MRPGYLILILIISLSGVRSEGQTTQSISLPNGWSMFSTYIQPALSNFTNVTGSISSHVSIIKDGSGHIFWPQFNLNNIGNIIPGKGYQAKMISTQTLSITGLLVTPEANPLYLPQGWEMLGYLRIYPSATDSVLKDILSNLEIFKDDQGNIIWPAFNIKQIAYLKPGKGYQIKLMNADTLTFASNDFVCISDYIPDYEQNIYSTLLIGSQCWMKENLKSTRYRNGTAITSGSSTVTWTNNYVGAYVWYNNSIANKTAYGALYNWYTTTNVNGLCPTGWHVSTDAEWTVLVDFLGGQSLAGGKLKETGTLHWNSPNSNASNETGFSAVAGGKRDGLANFTSFGDYGYYWTATESSSVNAWYRVLYNSSAWINRSANPKSNGKSVRCVKD